MSGRVQGVSFRACAAQEAARLGLAGWVRNEDDGSVLAHLEGPERDVRQMVDWCGHGSPSAQVRRVEVRDVAPLGTAGFDVDHGA